MALTKQQVETAAASPLAFFPHDVDSRGDRKIKLLMKRHGFEGYGRWWALCEILANADGHYVNTDDADELEILADELGFDGVGDFNAFVFDLLAIGLLANEGGFVYSRRMMENARYTATRRLAGSMGGRGRKKGAKGDGN